MFGIIAAISSLVGTGYSIYAGSKADKASEDAIKDQLRYMGMAETEITAAAEAYGERWQELKKVAEKEIEYRPITDEELDLYVELVNAKSEESMAEQRVAVGNKAAAAGYDPEEVLGQLEPELQKERDRLITQSVLKIKSTDMFSERQFMMNEDLRLINNQMNLYSMPSPEEVMHGEMAAIYSGQSQYNRGMAEFYGKQASGYTQMVGQFAQQAAYSFAPSTAVKKDPATPDAVSAKAGIPQLEEITYGPRTADQMADINKKYKPDPFVKKF